ncbi:restriction endonuclease-like protein [Gorillibacterium massiliense]|uniref:restriction endonuclease-like protein n=1 Tax=Gorillibacterium massiliense TaxID=1280390 RepID=UPI0004AE4782|nr:restriction endonuclease-like protein [Gorillibacterium massiliense]
MASPHTGYRNETVELLRIETNLFNLYIQGRPFHPTVETLQLHRDDSNTWVDAHFHVGVSSSNHILNSVQFFSPRTRKLEDWTQDQACEPIFFETQSYEVVIEKKQELPIAFHHENIHLRQAIKPLGKMLLSGVLNFQNEVGLTELELRLYGQTIFRLQLEVFPSKMDYKRDYEVILRDVNEQIYNLSFDFLRKTYHLTELKETKQQSVTEFFTILQHIFKQLVQAVDRIKIAPHYKMQVTNRKVEASKARKAGKENIAFLSKRHELLVPNVQHGYINVQGKRMLPSHVLETKRYMDYDTGENRFVRWVLYRIAGKLKSLRVHLQERDRRIDPMLMKKLDLMNSQMQRLFRNDFLQVGEMTHMSVSLVLQMAPGYREVYRYYLMLMKGLSIQSDLFRLSMKDLAQLYEYWCFLRIHLLMSNKYELLKQDIIEVNRNGIFVTLDRSQSAKMIYRNPLNGETFTLYYNALPKGDSTSTLAQRPDNILTLKKNDAATEYKYIFDAKYRLNPAYEGTPYWEKYKQPGPEEDDINTMHRYRDAIVYREEKRGELERSMFGAYVLFPYPDEAKFQEHKFYKSIQLVNIGAIPFLPNATSLMESFLDEIIQDSPEKAYERSTRPRGTADYFKNKFTGKNVLVGSLRGPAQLAIALKHKFYHMPLKNIVDHKLLTQIEYIAMCQSRKKFQVEEQTGIQWFGEIVDWKVVKRKEIIEIPVREGTGEELYVRFAIKEWKKRHIRIALAGSYIHKCLYTSKYMFDRAQEIAELRLDSEEDLKIWREARRSGKVKVKLDNEHVDLARNVLGIDVE